MIVYTNPDVYIIYETNKNSYSFDVIIRVIIVEYKNIYNNRRVFIRRNIILKLLRPEKMLLFLFFFLSSSFRVFGFLRFATDERNIQDNN